MSKIITIGRQFGSGGRELGKRLAEAMGIGYFDREVISEIARKSGLAETYVNNFVEKRAGYYPITIGRTFYAPMTLQMDTEVYRAQTAAIRELAGRGDCVIIGRCADVILKDYHPLNLFIYADMEAKVERCIRRAPEGEHLTRNEIERMIKQVDKNRAQYRQMYSDTKWGAKESYHLCVNTTEKYMKEIVPGLAAYVRCWFSEE